MLKFIGKRLIQMFLLFVLFLTAVFFLLNAQPGDITSQFLDPTIPAANRELIAQRLGSMGASSTNGGVTSPTSSRATWE